MCFACVCIDIKGSSGEQLCGLGWLRREGKTGAGKKLERGEGMREGTEKALDCARCSSSSQPQSFRNTSHGRSGETHQKQVEDFGPESRRGDTDSVRRAKWLLHPALDQESDSTTTSAQ